MPYVNLAALLDYANGVEVPSDSQTLLSQARCLQCIPLGLVQSVTLAILIDTINGAAPPATVNGMIARANCLFCLIPTGLLSYLLLRATIGLTGGTTTLEQLIADSRCLTCIPAGVVDYAILAALIDIVNGDTPPTNVNTLLSEATCLSCVIPLGLLGHAILETLRNLVITEPGTFLVMQDGTELVTQGGDQLVTN